MGQLHLELALPRAGVEREDVQDQRGPVEDLDTKPLLQASQLPCGELGVQDDRVRPGGMDEVVDLVDLPFPHEGRGVGLGAGLQDLADGLGTGRSGQGRQLLEGLLVQTVHQSGQDRPLANGRAPKSSTN